MSEPSPGISPRRYPTEPWGSYAPDGTSSLLIGLTRSIPHLPLLKQLVFPIRRLARSRMTGPVDHTLWGLRLRFRPHGNISEGRLLFLPDRWDWEEREMMAARLPRGGIFVDVGCNFGGYSWWMLSQFGEEIQVLALEPDPELHQALEFNLATNGIRNARVLPVAAGTRSGTAELHSHADNRGENSLIEGDDSVGARTVQVQPLAEIVTEAGLDHIDLLKIDIEGMEPAVLGAFFEQAPRSLWPRDLLFEWKETDDHRQLRDHLLELGYRIDLVTRMNILVHLPSA